MQIRVTRTARKHKVSVAHIRYVIENNEPDTDDGALIYIGTDERGIELEIVAVPDNRHEGGWAVIHAMPTSFRRRTR